MFALHPWQTAGFAREYQHQLGMSPAVAVAGEMCYYIAAIKMNDCP